MLVITLASSIHHLASSKGVLVLKIRITTAVTLLMVITIFATQSCSYFRKSDFTNLAASDLTALIDRLPDSEKRKLEQNEAERKKLIDVFKKAFAIAQAAEAEGLDKGEKFKLRMTLNTDQMLASEFTRRNPDINPTKEEVETYFASHKEVFEFDLNMISEGQKIQPTDEQKERLKTQWGEIKILADKARKTGLEKDPTVKVQLKFNRANILANIYSGALEERLKLTPEEKSKYIAEHPEADSEKAKQKAQDLLDRVKKGERFEEIADKYNDDGTRGRGGDLDWFGKGSMDPDFEKAAFALDKGQFSNELVKSSFGYHIIKVDDKRKVNQPPPLPGVPSPQPGTQKNNEQREEIRARHIYVSTREAESFEQRIVDGKVKRALEDAQLKYNVKAPADFTVNVGGYDPSRIPGLGGGLSGKMKEEIPNQNK